MKAAALFKTARLLGHTERLESLSRLLGLGWAWADLSLAFRGFPGQVLHIALLAQG
jgi:hypothetical protein